MNIISPRTLACAAALTVITALAPAVAATPASASGVTATSHFVVTDDANLSGDSAYLDNGATDAQPHAIVFMELNNTPGGVCGCLILKKPLGGLVRRFQEHVGRLHRGRLVHASRAVVQHPGGPAAGQIGIRAARDVVEYRRQPHVHQFQPAQRQSPRQHSDHPELQPWRRAGRHVQRPPRRREVLPVQEEMGDLQRGQQADAGRGKGATGDAHPLEVSFPGTGGIFKETINNSDFTTAPIGAHFNVLVFSS